MQVHANAPISVEGRRRLVDATLKDATLTYAILPGTDLTRANLTGADITRVTFNQAVLADTICPDGKVTSTGC